MNLKNHIAAYLTRAWYQKPMPWTLRALMPFSLVFRGIVRLRQTWYKRAPPKRLPVPVVVVGNITVGGTGKTPLVIALVQKLRARGLQPGVVLRGYGGHSKHYPMLVHLHSNVAEVGDEALVITQAAYCPVAVDPDRTRAARLLIQQLRCNVIVSDDGLQHDALRRDLEIAVIDARGMGNGNLLPAGPLREPATRLLTVDCVMAHGTGVAASLATKNPACRAIFDMHLTPHGFLNLSNQQFYETHYFNKKTIHAVSAIGHPERFFESLRSLGIQIIEHAFADHYVFSAGDLTFSDDLPVIMTHKDAVKCAAFGNPLLFYLAVDAVVDPAFDVILGEALFPRQTKRVLNECV